MAKELYVGNLSYEATEEDLIRVFSVAGTVTSVHIITDPESGASKGCAYVRMSREDEIKEAIESLDGALVGDRMLTVSVARPQQQRKPIVYQGKGRSGGRPGSGKGRR